MFKDKETFKNDVDLCTVFKISMSGTYLTQTNLNKFTTIYESLWKKLIRNQGKYRSLKNSLNIDNFQ